MKHKKKNDEVVSIYVFNLEVSNSSFMSDTCRNNTKRGKVTKQQGQTT
jgi:hypothetical protein